MSELLVEDDADADGEAPVLLPRGLRLAAPEAALAAVVLGVASALPSSASPSTSSASSRFRLVPVSLGASVCGGGAGCFGAGVVSSASSLDTAVELARNR